MGRAVLRAALKATNVLLLLLGAGGFFFSVWMYAKYEKAVHARDEGPVPPQVAPPPPPLAPGEIAALADKPWFIYAFGAAGAYVTLTASTGLLGAGYHNKCCLSLYNVELVLMFVMQLALAIAVFTKTGFNRLPPDPTGSEVKVFNLVKDNVPVFKWGGVAVLVLQAISLMLSIALKRQSRESSYDSDDDVDDYYERHYGSRAGRRPLISRGDAEDGRSPMRSPVRNDTWSQRMREKYNLDTSDFSYDPQRSPDRFDQAPPPARQESSCTLDRKSVV